MAPRPARLLLLGGGHAHLQVMRSAAGWLAGRVRITLVSPHASLTYSGLLPGVIAGRFAPGDATIALAPIAQRAGIAWLPGAATHIDAGAREVTVVTGAGVSERLGYDFLSVDVGGVMDRTVIPGADEHAVFVRPVEQLIEALDARLKAATGDAVVIGGGAGGFELVLGLRRRLPRACRVHLVTGPQPLLASHAGGVRRRARRALAERGVGLREEACRAVEADAVQLASSRLASALTLVAIGSSAPPWLRDSGLALDAAGFIRVGPTLQSVSHPEVYAAGDVASRSDASRPRSGVYAVRAGPPLAANLARALQGLPGEAYRPQRHALNLLSLADGRAIASWGPLALEGRAMGWLKDRIDRRFVALSRSA